MACNADFVQYIVDQCSGAGERLRVLSEESEQVRAGDGTSGMIVAKKMFVDYGIYCNGKIFGLICDDRLYVKPTEAGRALLRTIDLQPPYEGAKPYFYIAEVDDRDYLSALVRETCQALPEPKPKRKK